MEPFQHTNGRAFSNNHTWQCYTILPHMPNVERALCDVFDHEMLKRKFR